MLQVSMSSLSPCKNCGLKESTAYGETQQFCNHCRQKCQHDKSGICDYCLSNEIHWNPSGLTDPSEGDTVEHLHFSGKITGLSGSTSDGQPAIIHVLPTDGVREDISQSLSIHELEPK